MDGRIAKSDLNVPTADSSANVNMMDMIGNKNDTSAGTSLMGVLRRTNGSIATKSVTMNANNTTANVNCFQITGTVQLLRIYGILTAKTTLANCTATYFDLFDSTVAVAITKNDGVLSGMAVGTSMLKLANNLTTAVILDNAAGAYSDLPFAPCLVQQKTGANTYIRFNYTTTDAPANAVITVYVEYRLFGNATLTAV